MADRFTKLGQLGYTQATLALREAAKLADVDSPVEDNAVGTCVVNATNAGTGAAATATGTNKACTVVITPAGTPGTGIYAVLTYGGTWGSAPKVALSAGGENAAATIGAAAGPYVVTTTTTATIYFGTAGTADQPYTFDLISRQA